MGGQIAHGPPVPRALSHQPSMSATARSPVAKTASVSVRMRASRLGRRYSGLVDRCSASIAIVSAALAMMPTAKSSTDVGAA